MSASQEHIVPKEEELKPIRGIDQSLILEGTRKRRRDTEAQLDSQDDKVSNSRHNTFSIHLLVDKMSTRRERESSRLSPTQKQQTFVVLLRSPAQIKR